MNRENPMTTTAFRPPWRRMGVALSLPLAVLLFANPVGATSTDKAGGPPGNNGTVKIDGQPFDKHPDNQPHVGCRFEVDFYGFDKGDLWADVTFAVQPPTGKPKVLGTPDRVFIGGTDNSGGGSEAGLDAEKEYNLTPYLVDYQEHPQQGYHVKLTVNADGSQGADTKHKVFWVRACPTTPNPEIKPETKTDTVAVTTDVATDVMGLTLTNPAPAGPGATALGEQLVQAPAPVGGVATGGGGTSSSSNDLLPIMAGLGCIGLAAFASTRLRRRIV
jgi:hypothetical protein